MAPTIDVHRAFRVCGADDPQNVEPDNSEILIVHYTF